MIAQYSSHLATVRWVLWLLDINNQKKESKYYESTDFAFSIL